MESTRIVHISMEGCRYCITMAQHLAVVQEKISSDDRLKNLVSIDTHTWRMKDGGSYDKPLPDQLNHLTVMAFSSIFILTPDLIILQPSRRIVNNIVKYLQVDEKVDIIEWIESELKKIYPNNSKQNDG